MSARFNDHRIGRSNVKAGDLEILRTEHLLAQAGDKHPDRPAAKRQQRALAEPHVLPRLNAQLAAKRAVDDPLDTGLDRPRPANRPVGGAFIENGGDHAPRAGPRRIANEQGITENAGHDVIEPRFRKRPEQVHSVRAAAAAGIVRNIRVNVRRRPPAGGRSAFRFNSASDAQGVRNKPVAHAPYRCR